MSLPSIVLRNLADAGLTPAKLLQLQGVKLSAVARKARVSHGTAWNTAHLKWLGGAQAAAAMKAIDRLLRIKYPWPGQDRIRLAKR